VDARKTEGSRKNEPIGPVLATSLTVCRCRRRYAEQDCYWRRIMVASVATRNKAYFNAMETSQFTFSFNQKV
jgi:hypothetical protein